MLTERGVMLEHQLALPLELVLRPREQRTALALESPSDDRKPFVRAAPAARIIGDRDAPERGIRAGHDLGVRDGQRRVEQFPMLRHELLE